MSDFDLKVLQRVSFWIEKKYNALDFELKFFRHVRCSKIFRIRKIAFWFILLRENNICCNFRAFFNKHDFDLKFSLQDGFSIAKNTMRQILT